MNSPAIQSPAQASSETSETKVSEDTESLKGQQDSRDKKESFPVKLHRMLTEVEAEGNENIILFSISGRAFRIYQPNAFLDQIIPDIFI